MNEINTIKLPRIKKMKVLLLTTLYLSLFVLGIYTLMIFIEVPKDRLLLVSVYPVFIILLIWDIFLLFDTENKLINICLYIGVFFMSLSVLLYGTFLYISVKENVIYFIALMIIYILAVVIAEVIITIKKYYNFKQSGKKEYAFAICISGLVFGKGLYKFVEKNCSPDVSEILFILSLVLLSVVFGFLGIVYLNKFYIIKKYEYLISIVYE